MTDTLLINKCFIGGFSAGLIGAILFLYVLENQKANKTLPTKLVPQRQRPKKISGECKMVLVVRKDLKATKREIATNCVQACVGAYQQCLERYPKLVKHWVWNGSTKVALKVNNEAELIAIKNKSDERDIINYMIHDEDPSRKSALVLAVGPDIMEEINSVTGHLKLF